MTFKPAAAVLVLSLSAFGSPAFAEEPELPVTEHAFFPTAPGTSWTFRTTRPGDAAPVTTETTFTASAAPSGLELVSAADVERDQEIVYLDSAGAVVLRTGDSAAPDLVVRVTPQGVQVFEELWDGAMLGSVWSLPADLQPGARWSSAQVYLSCGFGIVEQTFAASAEQVTVPAGTFDAIRIDATDMYGDYSLWVVEGLGLVKQVRGETNTELARCTLLEGPAR
jgi:hypothetical protein